MRQKADKQDYKARLDALYLPRLAEHGLGPQAQGWPSRLEQMVRFAALTGIGLSPGDSVLDAGCGQGDLLKHLEEQGFQGRYFGIDLLPEMIETANNLRPPPGIDACFAVADLADAPRHWRADVVLASGIFVVMTQDEAQAALAQLFAACRRAFAFTCLSSWDPTPNAEGYLRLDPAETLNFCRSLTPRVLLRHEYFLTDFTVYLYRE